MNFDIIINDNFQLLAIYNDDQLTKVYFTSPKFISNYRIYLAHFKDLVSKKGGQVLSAKISSKRSQDLFLKSDKVLSKNDSCLVSFRNQALELDKLPIVALSPLIESKFHSLNHSNNNFNIVDKKDNKADFEKVADQDLKKKDKAWLEALILQFSNRIKNIQNGSRVVFDGLDVLDTCLIKAQVGDVIRVNSDQGLAKIKHRAKTFWPNLYSNIIQHKLISKKVYLDIQEALEKYFYINHELTAIFEVTAVGLNVDINIGLRSKSNKTSFYQANFSLIEKNITTILDRILLFNINGRALLDIPYISGKMLKKLITIINNHNKNIRVIDSTKTGLLELSVKTRGYPLILVENQLQIHLYTQN